MKYNEFISILRKLNYSKSSYKSVNRFYHKHLYVVKNRDLEIIINYIIDKDSHRVRQQFSNDEVVQLHIKPSGTSGDWIYLSYDACIDNIIDNGYGDVFHIRDFRLEKLLN